MSMSNMKNLLKYVLPAIFTNTCFFAFTIIDGIFVGQGIGTDALGAVNISMPFVMIAGALNMLTSIGGVTVVAIRLGRGDKKGANQAFMHSLTATLVISALVTVIGVCFTTPLSQIMGANETYLPMVKDYLLWWSIFTIPAAMSINFQSFCRNDGSPVLVGVATAIGTVLNIFLDWLFVFPMEMGLMGAALATGISQIVIWIIVMIRFLMKKGDLRICPFKQDISLYGKILFRGLPEMIAQFATPVTTLCMNLVLISTLGDIGINAYSIIAYVASFTMAVLFGASEGLQPLFGQAYGAKDGRALKYSYHRGMLICLLGSCLCVVLSIVFNRSISSLFGADSVTLEYTVRYLPKYAWGFIIAGLNTLISAYLYSTKRSKQAIVLNVFRSFILNISIIFALPTIFGSSIIWYTFGIFESIVFVIAVVILKYSERNGIVYK